VACHSERSEGAEVPAIVERDQAERNDDQQDRFLVDVPPEEERSISAESSSCNEVGPCRAEEKLDECRLETGISTTCSCQNTLVTNLQFERRGSK